MATRIPTPDRGEFDLLPLLPPEGPELDALIRAKVAEANADPRPPVPMSEAFDRIRANIARNV